jgi:hypothetical protein
VNWALYLENKRGWLGSWNSDVMAATRRGGRVAGES